MRKINIYNNIRRVAVATIAVATIGCLTGCNIKDENVQNFVNSTKEVFQTRVALNRGNLESLNRSGLITDEMYKGFLKSIDDAEKSVRDMEADERSLARLANATVEYLYKDDKSGRDETTTQADYVTIMGNYWNSVCYTQGFKENRTKDGLTYVKRIDESKIDPIKIIDEAHANKLNEILNYEVYVLKSKDEIQVGLGNTENGKKRVSGAVTLDGIKSAVKEVTGQGKSGDVNANKFGILNGYFKPSGIKLYDYSIDDNKPVKMSKYNTDFSINEPGKDLVLRQTLVEDGLDNTKANVLQIRFLEFDSEIIAKLINTNGDSGRKYIVQPGDGNTGGRVYLLEYPVQYIKEIQVDGNKYKSILDKSDLVVSLLDGALYNSNGNKLEQNNGEYFTTGTVDNPYLPGTASFSIEDNIKTDISGKSADAGAVLLRDYLELSYMPNIHESEDIVAAGRKIRVLEPNGTATSVFAKYCNIDNKTSSKDMTISITDLADINIGDNGDNIKLAFNGRVETLESDSSIDDIESDSSTELGGGGEKYTDKLNQVYKLNINPTTRFAGDKVDRDESTGLTDTNKLIMYGMVVDKNPFDTGLFSNWINNSDRSKDSIGWWLDWLSANNYTYKLNGGAIESFFTGNYQFEMADQGYIILDLKTICKIQTEYSEQKSADTVKWLRTTFMTFGFALMAYSLLILGCWTIDTNIDLGLNTLGKISFGKWIAVKNGEEINYDQSGDIKYLSFSGILIKASIIMTVAIIITTVDIVMIVKGFIDIFGGIAKVIDRAILGNI